MNAGEVISSIISGLGVIILGAIGRSLFRMGKEVHRFMAEHVWLISTTLWTRDKVTQIMKALDIPMDNPPPSDLEASKK